MDVTMETLVDIYLINLGTGENSIITSPISYYQNGFWDFSQFTQGEVSCDCVRSRMLYNKNPLYILPCNDDEPNTIIIEKITITENPDSIIYKEEILEDDDKQKKILQEIENLTPYLAELQEFKEKGLFIPPGAAGEDKPTPIFNEQGKRIDSKAKRKTKAEQRREMNAKAFKLRVLAINKWLDDEFAELLPKWAIKLIRKKPQWRPLILKLFIVQVEIVHKDRPKPYGSDKVKIKCFWSQYSEVNFVWEK